MVTRISSVPAGGAALSFTRYYDDSLAASASYTPTEGGLYGVPVGVTITYPLQVEYYSTDASAWQTCSGDSRAPFIADGSNARIKNKSTSIAYALVVMRMA